jgi:hypothetical protein
VLPRTLQILHHEVFLKWVEGETPPSLKKNEKYGFLAAVALLLSLLLIGGCFALKSFKENLTRSRHTTSPWTTTAGIASADCAEERQGLSGAGPTGTFITGSDLQRPRNFITL